MYNKFINKCEELLSSFKKTGDIESLLYLEAHISEFLDFAVEEYLDETNDSYINENTSKTYEPFTWESNETL